MVDSSELLRKLNRPTRSGRKSLVPIKTKSAETTTRAGFLAADLRPTMTLSMKRYDLMQDMNCRSSSCWLRPHLLVR
jgi:hypothetical protein